MLQEIFLGLGMIVLILLICMIIFIPLICTIILGTYFATALGLSGIVWWAFVIVFYLIIAGILGIAA